ncbi:hypothetical protein FF38_11587, partial [Lucilia cuprina]
SCSATTCVRPTVKVLLSAVICRPVPGLIAWAPVRVAVSVTKAPSSPASARVRDEARVLGVDLGEEAEVEQVRCLERDAGAGEALDRHALKLVGDGEQAVGNGLVRDDELVLRLRSGERLGGVEPEVGAVRQADREALAVAVAEGLDRGVAGRDRLQSALVDGALDAPPGHVAEHPGRRDDHARADRTRRAARRADDRGDRERSPLAHPSGRRGQDLAHGRHANHRSLRACCGRVKHGRNGALFHSITIGPAQANAPRTHRTSNGAAPWTSPPSARSASRTPATTSCSRPERSSSRAARG